MSSFAAPAHQEPSRFDAPEVQGWLGAAIAVVGFMALGHNALFGEKAPNGFVVLAALLSVVLLLFVGRRRDPITTAMRVGFHGGMFGFFLFMPLLETTTAELTLSEATADTVGWALLLTTVGFEGGYWARRITPRPAAKDDLGCALTPRQERWITRFMWMGLGLWLLVLLDYAVAAEVSLVNVLLTMRGAVEGANPEGRPVINTYIAGLLGSATYLSTACASILLTVGEPRSRRVRALAWVVLIVCGIVGWLRGSRAVFLYAFAPILTTLWPKLSSSTVSRGTRVLAMAAGLGVVSLAWGGQSVLRGGDIRTFEERTDEMSPQGYAVGAFDVFAELGPIVEAFPSLYPYQYGKSIIPFVLGWVPRPLWPSKPYPFALYASYIRGETDLDNRSASIAVGLTGEGFGQGGLLGVLLWAALMGIACRWGDERLGRFARGHPLRLQLAAICAIWAAMIVRGSPPEMFYMGLYVWLFVFLLARYVGKRCLVPVGAEPPLRRTG